MNGDWLHRNSVWKCPLPNRCLHFINVDKFRATGGELIWLKELVQTPSSDGKKPKSFWVSRVYAYLFLFFVNGTYLASESFDYLFVCPRQIFARIFDELGRRTLYCLPCVSFKYFSSSKLQVNLFQWEPLFLKTKNVFFWFKTKITQLEMSKYSYLAHSAVHIQWPTQHFPIQFHVPVAKCDLQFNSFLRNKDFKGFQ